MPKIRSLVPTLRNQTVRQLPMLRIRHQTADDIPAIHRLTEEALGQSVATDPVDALAQINGTVRFHELFKEV